MQDRVNSVEQLADNLATILVSWPLYRTYIYYGNEAHPQHITQPNLRYGPLPKRLKMYCKNDHCKQETWWETGDTTFWFSNQFIANKEYSCRNCGKESTCYYFIWQTRPSNNIFLKVGQYPELEERISEALASALDEPNLKMFKNALRLRNFNLGLAAVAYMRRVVENKMGEMLDILHDAATAHGANSDVLMRHNEMRSEKRFNAKVDYAGDLLPAYLRPPGKPNPMAILHELASDGLHSRSDEECIDIFDKCRATFEYVFGKMKIEAEDAKNFVRSMADLTQERTKAVALQKKT